MKFALFVVAAFTCLMAHGASACDHKRLHSSFNASCDAPVHWADRYGAEDVRFAITTENRKVVLILTDRVVAMQLSDRVLHKMDRKMREANAEDDNAVGHAIKTAVFTTVRTLLNHSAECDIRDIAKADYRDGELILTAQNGKRIFAHTDIDDDNVMRNFSESDARAFVRQLRQRMMREG
jgi:hypothetical protein